MGGKSGDCIKGSPIHIEPFFTTKERGQGSGVIHGAGLGLYTLKTIVTAKLNGEIDVSTQNGKTVAVVKIPIKINR